MQFDESESCTSIMVGKKASKDGSVIVGHTCDGNYRTWLNVVPSQHFKEGEKEPIFWGKLHNEEPWDMRNVEIKGYIPAPTSTLSYLNSAYPCLNEKQLAIGETTITGDKNLINSDGLFKIDELQRIALQRCSTAKDAVVLIGKLAQEYGYGDAGECLTIADKSEIWQLEIFGSGKGDPSAIWVAQRVPDNHVAISANIPRISKVDFNSSNFLYSSDIRERCKSMGLWDGKGDFIFWKINGGRKPFAIREFFVLNALAPSLNLSFDAHELPFSVKPDKLVDVQQVLALYRECYEGSEWDQTKDLVAEISGEDRDGVEYKRSVKPISNFMSVEMRALLNQIKPGITERTRTIAVIQCSYSQIIQLRDWLPDEIGGVAWFSFDNPAQSPRIPIYAGTTKLPSSFEVCGQHRYRNDAAIWSFRETNRISTINWDRSREIIEPEIENFEQRLFWEASKIEERALALYESGKKDEVRELLTNFTNHFAASAIERWRELKGKVLEIFIRSM